MCLEVKAAFPACVIQPQPPGWPLGLAPGFLQQTAERLLLGMASRQQLESSLAVYVWLRGQTRHRESVLSSPDLVPPAGLGHLISVTEIRCGT